MKIFDNIPFELKLDAFSDKIYPANYNQVEQVRTFLDQTLPLIKPKALYQRFGIETRPDGTVNIGGKPVIKPGIPCATRMQINALKNVKDVHVFLATCGAETETLDMSGLAPEASTWLEKLREQALDTALDFIENTLLSLPGTGKAILWPLQEQKELYELLGEKTLETIGVGRNKDGKAVPFHTLAGIHFHAATDAAFENPCGACRSHCPGHK